MRYRKQEIENDRHSFLSQLGTYSRGCTRVRELQAIVQRRGLGVLIVCLWFTISILAGGIMMSNPVTWRRYAILDEGDIPLCDSCFLFGFVGGVRCVVRSRLCGGQS